MSENTPIGGCGADHNRSFFPLLPLVSLRQLSDVLRNGELGGDSSSARSGARQAREPNELSAQALPRTRDPLPVAGSTPEAE